MTTEDRKEIISYLTGPRNFAEGVRLYGLHGQNRMLKRRFAVDDTEFTRTLLVEELRKLAGLSDAEFRRLPRLARRQPVVTETVPQPQKESCNVPAPESVMRMVRFRDRYPFLKYPDCPDILKVLVADMFTAYDAYRESFERLQEMPDEATAESMAEAEKTVTAYLNNRAIWAELDHYRDTGLILGNHPKLRDTAGQACEDLTVLSDLELVRKLDSARANQSKQRTRLKEAEESGKPTEAPAAALARWTDARTGIEAEIERRKKKSQTSSPDSQGAERG